MTSFETRVRDSLDKEDEAFLQDLEGDRGLFTQIGGTFSGPLKYWTAIAFVSTFVMLGLAVWCAWSAFQADTVKAIVIWAGFAVAAFNGVGLLKMWVFMRMNHLETLREIKRMELRLTRLNEN